jgi:hypothetical protein
MSPPPVQPPRAHPALAVQALAALLCLAAGCTGGSSAEADAGADAGYRTIDICDAFTGVDSVCPMASPVRCFAYCEAGGCYCSVTAAGARWSCVIDMSCTPDCGPLDDGCAGGP